MFHDLSIKVMHKAKLNIPSTIKTQNESFVKIMGPINKLSLAMSWIGCLLKDSELFVLFAKNCQILHKISVIPILFIHLLALNLLVNNQLKLLVWHIIVTLLRKPQNRAWCPKFATGLNVYLTNISNHFFTNYMNIFHKTEVHTVILRYWKGSQLNWFKSYGKKR